MKSLLRSFSDSGAMSTDIPRIETVALTGKAVEGDILTAVEIIPKSEIQERVWAKYRKDIKYTWYFFVFIICYPGINCFSLMADYCLLDIISCQVRQ